MHCLASSPRLPSPLRTPHLACPCPPAGIDYLKYDNCFAPASDWVIDRYIAMRDALNRTGRPIIYSMCEWGVADPWLWAPKVGNSWRSTEVRCVHPPVCANMPLCTQAHHFQQHTPLLCRNQLLCLTRNRAGMLALHP